VRKASKAAGYTDEVDLLMTEEARRGARFLLPFLLPTLYLVWVVVRGATDAPGVRAALLVAVGLVFVRWGVLATLLRAGKTSAANAPWRRALSTTSAWLVSGGFAGIYVAVGPTASSVQLLMLTLIASALCALAIVSMTSSLATYVGYVAINLGSLAAVLARTAHPDLVPILPLMIAFFVVAMTLLATRNTIQLRERILLGIELRDSALRDTLTGLHNRAYVSSFAEQRAARIVAQRREGAVRPLHSPCLALLLVDLDHFKAINDTHGHAAGDHVLSSFASLAQSTVRAHDVVARWGGEEFLVVMEVPDRDAANAVAERMRRMIAAKPIELPGGGAVTVTCSIGACLFPFDASSPDALTWQETLELADGSLYQAKRSGRNRTVWVSQDPDVDARDTLAAMRTSVAKSPALDGRPQSPREQPFSSAAAA
jgi:diguanylate cyclase (GGDEF)-like protein